jgi:integrase
LRAGEVVMLRVSDIDSKRMLIRVELVTSPLDRLLPPPETEKPPA